MSPCAPGISPNAPSCAEEENPLMALVDAASSILDKAPTLEAEGIMPPSAHSVTDSTSESDASQSCASSVTSAPGCVDSKSVTASMLDKKLSFAEQLMAVLDDESYTGVLQWMPNGKSFTITNPKKFTQVEMPELFNIRNMSSFVRKLTRWGFTRVHEKETMNSDIFKHKQFEKDNLELCAQIKCMARQPSSSSVIQAARSTTLLRKALMDVATPLDRKVVSSTKLLALPTTTLQPPKTVGSSNKKDLLHDSKAMDYLDESRRMVHSQAQKQLLQNTSDALVSAITSLRRERVASLTAADPSAAVNTLALQRMIEVSQQQQLAQHAWLRNERLHALKNAHRLSWTGGFPALY